MSVGDYVPLAWSKHVKLARVEKLLRIHVIHMPWSRRANHWFSAIVPGTRVGKPVFARSTIMPMHNSQ